MDERSHQKRQSYVKKCLQQGCGKICRSPFFLSELRDSADISYYQ